MNVSTKIVILWNVLEVDEHVARVVNPAESDCAVGKLGPVFEFPLHFNLRILLQRNILALNGPIKHFQLASGHRFTHSQTACKLAHLDLIGHCAVDYLRRHIKKRLYLR